MVPGMRTLHGYLIRNVLATLLLTVAVFTFVLLLGNVLKEILALLVNRQATLSVVLKALALLIPYVLVFAMPMGMLTATLLVFGRFSADLELTAVRGSGVSLVALVSPVLLLSAALALVCAAINLEIAPRCRVAYKDLLYELRPEQSAALIAEGRLNQIQNYGIYVRKKDGPLLEQVELFQLDDTGLKVLDITAERARIDIDEAFQNLTLQLEQARVVQRVGNRWQPRFLGHYSLRVPIAGDAEARRKPKLSELTLGQLLDERKTLEIRLNETVESYSDDLRFTTPVEVQIHRQVSFSFACIGFTLIGIPLGVRAHRRETMPGVAIALGLVLVYYCFIIMGQALDTHPEWAPHLILWIPNFLFQVVGAVLLWRVNRGV